MRKLYFFLFLVISIKIFGQNIQIINPSEIKINGTIPIYTTKNNFVSKFGKPENIVEDFPGCSNYDEEASKGTKFYIHSKNDIKFYVYNNQAEFQNIELKNYPKNYVLFGKIKISRTTNLTDLQKAFPIAYKNYRKEKGISFLRLKFNAKWDDEIQIGIENGKVTSISYWNPC